MVTPRNRPLKVGLLTPTWEHPEAGSVTRWKDIRERVLLAEALGFDSMWMVDHFLWRNPPEETFGFWDGWSALSALADATSRVELGLLVACTSYRHPTLIARIADTIDEISDGRLILGIGAGWTETEFRALGAPYDHRASRFEEALTIIATLLREGEIDFEGTYYQAREVELRPRGPRSQGPPIMVGATRDRMIHLAARHADILNRDFGPVSDADLESWQARTESACATVGRDPATLERTVAVAIDLPNAQSQVSRSAITGTPGELAESLSGIAAQGFSHVQIWLEPATMAGIEEFAATLELLDESA
ncbi:LLM class F420-dependent oxidoreductase [soil metagenome]